MDRILNYTITSDYSNMTILNFLRNQGFSRHILSSMKADASAITLNGRRGYGHTLLKDGDILCIRILETGDTENIVPTNLPLSILYEDEDILVVNKAANMPVHPSLGNYTNTLANAVMYYFSKKDESCPFRCINRLDRDTSGALIIAKNTLSAAILSAQMRNRQIKRTYIAVVEGITDANGTISAPISRVSDSVIERHVDFLIGESAITHYNLIETKNNHSLLEIHLETGRTHQIRVHMKYIGHPLPADFLYNPVYTHFTRQPLHSLQLEFTHPVTHAPICLMAPVPDDIYKCF